MASSSSSHGLKDTGVIYRRAPVANISLGGSGQAAREVKGGGVRRGCDLEGGVRGMSGAITMERSEDEKLKFPDRVPILEDEPALRLLSLQHNFIKRIQHLDSTYRLVFLDLYHNRLDTISNLEPLINLRVLMLGKNRIRRIEGLQKCNRLSVLDLHGNRITQITGLENLSDLKVLNLAGNLIRKITNLQDLKSLEELNIRRNRIRATQGLEVVPTLEKLYMSNNDIQNIACLSKLDALVKLHTVQMEGNPVWSNPEYAYHLVTSLPELNVLDQQEIATEVRDNAAKWRQSQQDQSNTGSASGARHQLMKKMEERNVSIVNAKQRWTFLKKQDWKQNADKVLKPQNTTEDEVEPTQKNFMGTIPKHPSVTNTGEEQSEAECDTVEPETVSSNPSLASLAVGPSLCRQASKTNLKAKLNNMPLNLVHERGRSSPGSPKTSADIVDGKLPAPSLKNEHLRKKFPGLEKRKFALPHRFVSLQHEPSLDLGSPTKSRSKADSFATLDKKIGFFPAPPTDETQSTSDEFSGVGLVTDSSSESSSSDVEEAHLAIFPPQAIQVSAKRVQSSADSMSLRRNASTSRLARSEGPERSGSRPRIASAQGNKASAPSLIHSETGRTSEQGTDYLIELDGDLLSVYGAQSLKFLDRPWNRPRAQKASTVQFNFVSFDDLVQYLPKFRQSFPHVENFEFLETDIHCLGQLNALGQLQGITSLFIGDEGNSIHPKNWKTYAVYRLEHWGLQYINNTEITDQDILEANQTYGSVGELALMVLPHNQILALVKKFELTGSGRDLTNESNIDVLSLIKDPNVKEIIAKESLQYKPRKAESTEELEKHHEALLELMEVGHSALHKFGRLEQEWGTLLPILIKRILSQYSDLRQYKKDTLLKLEKMDLSTRLGK
ncbi:hypothetical protein TCAL_08100 [Tigriopus californicus]|uniref:Dynein axonemal assembly factor 1 homolog n=1 Tax=Tigriopus californicus TaxID=6832 RepID=A0A553PQ05_TIGCA|nr:hypothetical protein TCAL_08100 [Tigriopus californicus]|eukprot:TCALIF_08100-PA protein Name:"Similar to Lrrc49 Leucine-rich repeat-containing protein 49 (Mus musculus)" AED:0.03 eAED:0.10 QI:25/0.66/0.25/1/1/1/4/436/895